MSDNKNNSSQNLMGLPMKGGPGGGKIVIPEKAKNFGGTTKKLLKYIGHYKISLIIVLAFAMLSTCFNIWGPKILGRATTELFDGLLAKISGKGGIDFEKIWQTLLLLLGVYVLSSVFSFIQGYIMSGITQNICYKIRKQISEKMHRIPMKYFESRTVGEILSRITNDVDTLGQNLNQSVSQIITSIVTVIGILIMMLTISWIMTLVVVVIVPISLVLVTVIVKFSQKHFKTQQEYLGKINGQVEEVCGGHNVIKAFNHEKIELQSFNTTNKVLFKSAWLSQFLSGIMQPIMNFVGNLGYVGVAVTGGFLVIKGSIEIGDIQAFIQYVRNFTQPISQLSQISNVLQSMVAAAERVFEFLEEEEEDQTVENPVRLENIEGNVDFENVYFGYDKNKMVINNFSCDIHADQKVAIVGPSGSGKTTLVKLLVRFYDVNKGKITLEENNIKNFNRSELREHFSMVLQETWLFKGSIMENIRYGNLDATDEEVIEAAKIARSHDFIGTLPNGYDMELTEEASNISQGQKQLLTIARAVLDNKPILILDEATSSVDTRTELLIQKAMSSLMKGRTSFVIAHRLSTIKDANLILVMNHGNVIEQGSHQELIDKQGFYANLYNSQFEETSV